MARRYCFLLRVRPERMDEYRRRHEAVWPDMLRALAETGWRNYSLFLHDDGLLVGYVEADDLAAAQAAMADTEVNARWQAEPGPDRDPRHLLRVQLPGPDLQRQRAHLHQAAPGLQLHHHLGEPRRAGPAPGVHLPAPGRGADLAAGQPGALRPQLFGVGTNETAARYAIAGGIGRVGGVLMASLLIVWLNAGILLYFEGSQGSQYQLFALGAVLLASALFNALILRRRGAT